MKKYIPFMRLQNYEGDNKLKVSDIEVSCMLLDVIRACRYTVEDIHNSTFKNS